MKLNTIVGMFMAALLILVEHYLPWTALLGRPLPVLARVLLGMLAILLPVTWLVLTQPNWNGGQIALMIWLIATCAGGTSLGVYLLDAWLAARARADIAEREALTLRQDLSGREVWDEDAGTNIEKPDASK